MADDIPNMRTAFFKKLFADSVPLINRIMAENGRVCSMYVFIFGQGQGAPQNRDL
jgi:hypothetical protein